MKRNKEVEMTNTRSQKAARLAMNLVNGNNNANEFEHPYRIISRLGMLRCVDD